MRRLAVLGVMGLMVVLLVVAQLVLPGIAAQRLRERFSRSGSVISVEVAAFPAIELLWHQADSVDIHLASYHTTTGSLGRVLEQAAEAGTIDATVDVLNAGLVTLRSASMRKRGNVLTGTATLTTSDLQAALPGLNVHPVASGGGKIVLQGTALGLTADATLSAQNGALRITPDVPLLAGLLTITVFADPHVSVQGVIANSVPGGYSVFATARLR